MFLLHDLLSKNHAKNSIDQAPCVNVLRGGPANTYFEAQYFHLWTRLADNPAHRGIVNFASESDFFLFLQLRT